MQSRRSIENPLLQSDTEWIECLPSEASVTSAMPLSSQQSICLMPTIDTSQAEWHLNFVIPELRTFSQFVAEANNSGAMHIHHCSYSIPFV